MKNKMNILIFLGLLLGIIGGLVCPKVMDDISFIGTIYINLLKFIIMPIIFTSVMTTIYKSKGKKNSLLIKSLIVFISMFVIIFLLTSLILFIFNPGNNVIFDSIDWAGEIVSLKASEVLVNLFPSDIASMVINNSVFACILLAFFSGIAAINVNNGDKVIDVVEGFKNIFNKLLEYIMYLTPVGVLSLTGITVANYGATIIGIGAKYIGMAYLCSLVSFVLAMLIPIWIFSKINPIKFIKKIWQLWIMTLTTCSSLATLPYAIKVCKDNFKVEEEATDMVMSFGCMVHKCGGAVSFAILGIFCFQLTGEHINLALFLFMIVSALLINMAAPGIPSGGIVLGATYLSMLGLPLIFIGVYSGIYRLLDMAYTTMNVTGNVTSTILISNMKKS